MYAHELYEQNKLRVVVTYPGRFQPFHQGHAGVFARLQKEFGNDNVYIVTSNDTSSAKSPFNFSDKYQLITAAGVPADKIVQSNSMYTLPDGIDPNTTVFVTAVGSPDADRLRPDSSLKRDKKDAEGNIIKPAGSPGYYRTWGKDQTPLPASEAGYVVIIPEIHKSITIKGKVYDVSHGTECRNLWNMIRNDAEARAEFLTQMYAIPSPELATIFDKIPYETNEDIAPTDSNYSSSPISGARAFHEEAAGVGVIASKKQAKDPRYSMSLTKDVRPGAVAKSLRAFRLAEQPMVPLVTPPGLKSPAQQAAAQLGHTEELEEQSVSKHDMVKMVKEFLPLAMKELKIKKLPRIILQKHVAVHDGQATFGRFVNEEEAIYLGIANRHPVDILRTLAHELVHFKQYEEGKMYPGAGDTGSPIENEAHWVAGIIMRHFNKKYPDAINSKPLELNEDKKEDKCPPATQDIALNLKNRQKAIDEYGYGPLNPDLPNTKFWMKKVDEWNLDSVDEAKQSLCGNCAAFDQRQHTLDCIAQGIDQDQPADAETVIDAGDLGYCKFLKFKCASRRTCDAWVTGGPLTDSLNEDRHPNDQPYGYGPLNPDLPNTKFWMKKVDEWNLDSVDEAKQSLCGNCAAFDQRQHTLDCIAQGIDQDQPADAETVIDAGDLGYCKFLKFKCASRRTCDAWVTGGPLTDSLNEDRHPNDQPYGPESKPTMPKGTVRVDVSDVYDWYKLGQHISNLRGLGHHDFGQGPPSTIVSFGSEEEEHDYIKDLEKIGLTTTDIDPVDPNQPKGMPRQKVDPTYNVGENFADGRNPQDKGDSKRYNVPTKGSISSLRKIAKQGGRRGQLAHWMANMKAGKAKKK